MARKFKICHFFHKNIILYIKYLLAYFTIKKQRNKPIIIIFLSIKILKRCRQLMYSRHHFPVALNLTYHSGLFCRPKVIKSITMRAEFWPACCKNSSKLMAALVSPLSEMARMMTNGICN